MLQNICRICAIATDATNVTKLFEGNTRKLLRQIKLITGVMLESNVDFPEIICNICQNDLNCAIEFRKRCLRNQKRWTPLPTEPKSGTQLTASPLTTHVICVRRSGRLRDCDNGENEIDWKPPSPVQEFIELESLENNTNGDDGIDHLKTETNDKNSDINISEDEAYEPEGNTKLIKQTKPKQPIPDYFCDHLKTETSDKNSDIEMSEEETYEPQKKTKSIKQTKAKQPITDYFCDQCGKKLKGKSALDRHLRKHNGVRPFKCDLCTSRFLSAGELKGHQVKHTGARDFPCRFCDRAYVNHSGRQRHERTHTNDRPFACTQCSKAFTTSYILKNHMLTHTGERMFRCDLCERSFSRETHLQAHYRSNTHKNNVEKSVPNLQLSTVEEVCVKPDIILA